MNLVIWHHDAFPTAPGVYLDAFPRRGHRVTWVIATEGDRHRTLVREAGGVRTVEIQRPRDTRLPRPFGAIVNRWHKLVRLFAKAYWMNRLAAERPDVLQVRDQLAEAVLARFFTRLHGVPFAYQWDFPHFEARLHLLAQSGKRRPLLELGMRSLIALRASILRGAAPVLPISEGQALVAQRRHGVAAARLVPFPVGVAPEETRRARAGTPHPRAAAIAGQPVLCYLGNLEAMRQPTLIFEVFAAVLEEMPEARILLVGGTNPSVERLLDRFPGRDRMVLTGRVPHADVAATLATARVGVFPIPIDDPFDIYRTSSPLKVVEYMASGLPVVSSRVEDAERLLGESGGGVCVDNDPRLFARAVAAYLRDPERAAACGEKGRAYVERHRSFDALARELEGAYERLLATGRPAPASAPASPHALPARREV